MESVVRELREMEAMAMTKSNSALDRAVAEKIMGLEVRCHEYSHFWSARIDGKLAKIPAYSTDPALAMQVIEEMRKTHEVYVIFDPKGGEVTMLGLPERNAEWEENFCTLVQFGRAVCRAALRARGHSTEGL